MNALIFGIQLQIIGGSYMINPPMAYAVYSQLMAHQTLKWSDSGVDYIVPFHAVMVATIYRVTQSVEASEDANCE